MTHSIALLSRSQVQYSPCPWYNVVLAPKLMLAWSQTQYCQDTMCNDFWVPGIMFSMSRSQAQCYQDSINNVVNIQWTILSRFHVKFCLSCLVLILIYYAAWVRGVVQNPYTILIKSLLQHTILSMFWVQFFLSSRYNDVHITENWCPDPRSIHF